jgi:stress-induced morphogen
VVTVEETIRQKLAEHFSPVHLEVVNESHMHSVPKGSETHFKVLVVSDAFAAMGPVDRHRTVNGVLRDQFAAGLHALSLRTLTPEQWKVEGGTFESPPCLGGSKAG